MIVETDFIFKERTLELSDDLTQNSLKIDGIDYYVAYLDPEYKYNKGGNSLVYKLYAQQTFNEDVDPDLIVKISKFPDKLKRNRKHTESSKNIRFWQEVHALYECNENKVGNIIRIYDNGIIVCRNNENKKIALPFYTMEYAEGDLKRYLEENTEVSDSERVELCLQIAYGIKELYSIGYYHRDIKPDNIFIVDGTWKIGDLGLISSRNSTALDRKGEFIGPRGWISPETMNKYLSENIDENKFDCIIDHQSDIFQLAKVFWYILQGNAPIGCVKETDFLFNNPQLYSLIKHMLNHAKKRRPASVDIVIDHLQKIVKKYYK